MLVFLSNFCSFFSGGSFWSVTGKSLLCRLPEESRGSSAGCGSEQVEHRAPLSASWEARAPGPLGWTGACKAVTVI